MTLPLRSDIVHVIDSVANAAAGPSYSVPAICRALATEGNSVTLMSIGEEGDVTEKGFCDRRLRQDYGRVPLLGRLRLSRAMQSELRMFGERKDVIFPVHGLWLMAN